MRHPWPCEWLKPQGTSDGADPGRWRVDDPACVLSLRPLLPVLLAVVLAGPAGTTLPARAADAVADGIETSRTGRQIAPGSAWSRTTGWKPTAGCGSTSSASNSVGAAACAPNTWAATDRPPSATPLPVTVRGPDGAWSPP